MEEIEHAMTFVFPVDCSSFLRDLHLLTVSFVFIKSRFWTSEHRTLITAFTHISLKNMLQFRYLVDASVSDFTVTKHLDCSVSYQ